LANIPFQKERHPTIGDNNMIIPTVFDSDLQIPQLKIKAGHLWTFSITSAVVDLPSRTMLAICSHQVHNKTRIQHKKYINLPKQGF
jgi:hypothetical protein